MKEIKYLNFEWMFKENCGDDYESEIWNNEGYIEVDLPHTVKELPLNYFNEKSYQFTSCYKKIIRVLPSMLKKHMYLVCEGIAHTCTIYINDKLVMHHEGGYDEFRVNLDEYLTELKDYTLLIFVNSTELKDIPPFGNVVDYLGYGGIYREVYLEMLDDIQIEDIYVKSYDPINSNIVNFDIKVNGGTEINIEIDGISVDYEITNNQDIYNYTINNKVLWSIDNPHLYTAKVKLYNGYTIADERYITFGLREAKFTSEGFYLNGKKTLLRGLNRHQSYPYVGYAMPERLQRMDALILKKNLGVNVVRCSHYMQSKYFLDECDKLGLLVIEELPGWQYIGGTKFKELSYQNITSMITRDKNHPSIILWGVRINESSDDKDFYKKTNMLAHRLDDLRQTCGVRNFANSELLEDVYTYNDFSNNGGKIVLSPKKKITNIKNPYLVTENNGHMYPTKSFDNEARRVEHSLRHVRVIDISSQIEGLSGMISWCMNDYNTHKDFGSGDMICYHGVLDMFRNPKLASYAYSSQQDEYPVLEVASSMNIGEYDASLLEKIVIYTNLDYVKVYLENNDKKIILGDYYPDKKMFKGMKHPPIILDDFIGSRLIDEEKLSVKDSQTVKTLFKEIQRNGFNMSLINKLKMFRIIKKYKYTFNDAVNLYFKYSSLWTKASYNIVFVGYKNIKALKTVRVGEVMDKSYEINPNNEQNLTMQVASTYDVMKFDIRAIDQNKNLLPYASDSFRIETEGKISLIGPKLISLIGGQGSFFVKTNTNKRKEKYLNADKKDVEAVSGIVKVYDNFDKLIYEKEIEVLLEK